MKTANELQPLSEIPSPLLWEILSRVPVKTCLTTCKLVCKEWYRIMNSPEFSSFRCHCGASRFNLLFYNDWSARKNLVFSLVEIGKALDLDDLGRCIVGVDHFIKGEPIVEYGLWYTKSHCNGVVCFANTKDYSVCNLVTGQSVKLQNLHELNSESCSLSGCELGFCPVSGKFKVLMILMHKAEKVFLAKIQTVGNGEWRTVENVPLKHLGGRYIWNGCSHWHGDNCIWSFEFGKEKFLRVPYPDDVMTKAYQKKNKMLSTFDSCLCLSCSNLDNVASVEIDIWIMKEHGVKDSWVKQFVIVSDPWCVPLVRMGERKILVTSRCQLYLYDPLTHDKMRVTFERNGTRIDAPRLPPILLVASFSRF
ncbi:unnamed protein product [Cuscuta campestris]|uniref:F-box domain-containing protein n=1 Tax=Cuscuta campestris TaxID=132261 RepID=A0A484MPI1_9ASTE|nr:unnamed protein product [Cuscuta campestris]